MELNLEQRRALFTNYAQFVEMLGQERVDAFIADLPISRLTEEYKSPLRTAGCSSCAARPPWHKGAVPVGVTRGYTFVRDGGWEKRDYDCPCETWLVPNKYQGLCHPDLVGPALLEMFPWLTEFKLDIYQVHFYDNRSDELFVRLSKDYKGHKSLYVPYAALFSGDVDAIVERNEEYLRWFCGTDDVWNAMKADPGVIEFLKHVAEFASAEKAAA